MCDDHTDPGFEDPKLSRRTFGLITGAAVVSVANVAGAQVQVVERDVEIRTPDGTADAALYYPQGSGRWPGVLMWPDIMTLRPAFRDMGRRLAADGFVVLVPNFYYRSQKTPINLNFSNPEERPKLMEMRSLLTSNEAKDKDAAAYLAFIDAQPQTDKSKKIGTQGYCMGGEFAFRTALVAPDRVGAVTSFHGGGLTTNTPNSPHLIVEKTKADYLIAIAQNDDRTQPESKDILRETFTKLGRPHKVEVYPADHGWMVKGSAVYNEAQAERGWAEMVAQYKRAL